MKIAVISDVHSNLEALEAVLEEVDERGAEALYCLGDIVGYGPDPIECIELLREQCTGIVRGNHDSAVANEEGMDVLPDDGREAAKYNRAMLSKAERAYLGDLPLLISENECTFVHATPDEPDDWKRIDSYLVAQKQFKHFDTPMCFAGHTHIPAIMADKLGVLNVRPGHRYFVNVGSVGQPRDRNPRACVTFFDTDSFEHELVRVPYNVERTAEKILEAGLPHELANRLKDGR